MRNAKLAMLVILAAGAAAVASPRPAAAYDSPWCITGGGWGYPGECYYQTYAQCLASASGRRVWCNVNPRVAFGQQRRGRTSRDY